MYGARRTLSLDGDPYVPDSLDPACPGACACIYTGATCRMYAKLTGKRSMGYSPTTTTASHRVQCYRRALHCMITCRLSRHGGSCAEIRLEGEWFKFGRDVLLLIVYIRTHRSDIYSSDGESDAYFRCTRQAKTTPVMLTQYGPRHEKRIANFMFRRVQLVESITLIWKEPFWQVVPHGSLRFQCLICDLLIICHSRILHCQHFASSVPASSYSVYIIWLQVS